MKLTLKSLSYTTAICLAGFSGGGATYGMTKLVPGGELVVGAMGALFEAGKLSSFALLHRRAIPRLIKVGLATVSCILVTANVAGVSGFLSSAYEHRHMAAQASGHVAQASAHASAGLIERQLAAAESTLAAARIAQIKAKDDKARARAAKQIVDQATAERDALVQKLAAAQSAKAQAEGDAINAGLEFAAIDFIAGATGTSTDRVAHAAIVTISTVPDVLAVLLLLSAGCMSSKAPARARAAHARKASRGQRPRAAALKVVEAN